LEAVDVGVEEILREVGLRDFEAAAQSPFEAQIVDRVARSVVFETRDLRRIGSRARS
jgi:hypothetical protein